MAWDTGDSARYHRIEKGGKVIAEIEYADEDTRWERYQADEAAVAEHPAQRSGTR